jgi:hypothetical protein
MGYQSPMRYRLVIGTKSISSWSLRPWLAMRQAGIPFEEIKIALRRPAIGTSSPPCLPSPACWRGRKPPAWKLPMPMRRPRSNPR